MRIARIAALVFTALCLVAAAASLVRPATLTFAYGPDARTVDCGSAASPKTYTDFARDIGYPPRGDRRIDAPEHLQSDAINCAGLPSASTGLYGILLAGVGLVAVAITSRRGPAEDTTTPEDSAAAGA